MNRLIARMLVALLPLICLHASARDGDLDPSFGNGGKLLLPIDPYNNPVGSTLIAKDMVVQPDGKIVIAGYAATASQSEWVVIRLNANGTYDNTFGIGGNGIAYFYVFGPLDNQATSIALRSDGHIVVGGTINDGSSGLVTAVVIQLNSDGSSDSTWGNNGAVFFTPAAGDATRTRAIVIDTVDSFALGNVYLVGQYTHTENNFFYAGISPDGQTKVSNTFQASESGNVSESATSVAVQPGTGNIIIGGYAASTIGEVHCAAIATVILVTPALKEAYVYTGWGSSGLVTMQFSMATHNNDFCDAMTLDARGYMMLGGHGQTDGAVSYQSGIAGLFDNNGTLVMAKNPPYTFPDMLAFTYDGHPGNGDSNTINRFILNTYDTTTPRFITVGQAFDGTFFPGTTNDFGIGRLWVQGASGFIADTSFNGGMSTNAGFSMVDYSACGQDSCSFTSNETANSAAFDPQGRLIVVGQADDPRGGTDIAIIRMNRFDGIFKGGFDTPEY
jgi:uncharacterized delta-60 repeat protein